MIASTIPKDVTTFGYDGAGQTVQVEKHPIAWMTTHSYDPAGRLVRIFNGRAADPAYDRNAVFTYTYDPAGNRTGLRESVPNGTLSGLVTWTYDHTYQLTREERSGDHAYDWSYAYDPVGNRVDESNNLTSDYAAYAIDPANQLEYRQENTDFTFYTYDAAGNLRTVTGPNGGITTSTWDDENRRTRVQLPSGVINTFVYNGDGQRVEKQDSTGTTRFIWDRENLLAELDGLNDTQALFTQTPDRYGLLVARRVLNATEFYEYDATGSARRLIWSSSGAATAVYRYRAFGETTRVSGILHSPFAWIAALGYYYDRDLAEYNLRARDYGVAIARFLSPDPLGFDGGDENWYRYVGNNPVSFTDPNGLQFDNVFLLCNNRQLTNKILNKFCEDAYGKTSAATVCKAIVKSLGGKNCNSLWAYCSHISRHPSDFGKNAYKICLSMHNAMCI